jgi:hypothetical protein
MPVAEIIGHDENHVRRTVGSDDGVQEKDESEKGEALENAHDSRIVTEAERESDTEEGGGGGGVSPQRRAGARREEKNWD